MTEHEIPPGFPLPAGWSQHARSVTLHVISLAHFALAYTRGWANYAAAELSLNLIASPILPPAVTGGQQNGLCRNASWLIQNGARIAGPAHAWPFCLPGCYDAA